MLMAAAALLVPPLWAWQHMVDQRAGTESALYQLGHTRHAIGRVLQARARVPEDVSGSFGQADAVRLINSALVEAGLSPSIVSELSLRDDAVRREGQTAGRLQRLTIVLRPIETVQLGRVLAKTEEALPSFTITEITLHRPGQLEDTDTRYGGTIAYERVYTPLRGEEP